MNRNNRKRDQTQSLEYIIGDMNINKVKARQQLSQTMRFSRPNRIPNLKPYKATYKTTRLNISANSIITSLIVLLTLSGTVLAASIARGYQTNDQDLGVGMAASLAQGSTTGQFVERATVANQDKFVGIVTTKDNSSLLITPKNSNVLITTEGQAETLVTDITGEVKIGDFLTLSPLKGYLMKAQSSGLKSVGVALEDFNSKSASVQKITNTTGQDQEVKVDSIAIEVTTATEVAITATTGRPFLSVFAKSLTGREVDQWQVVTAFVVLFVLLVATGAIIYSAVHTTIEALGRNPLAHSDIYRQLLQVMIISIGLLVFGGVMIYLLLWS